MMYCPNCGTKANEGDVFCGNCGNRIGMPSVQPNQVQQTPAQQPVYNSDEFLISSYVGKNYDKLKKEGFSVNIFFLGSLYAMYRKMWLLSILWIVGSIIGVIFLPSFISYINIAVNIILSINFNKMYMKHVKDEVGNIKSKNPNSSIEQLSFICKRKGGTVLWAPLLVGIAYFIVVPLVFIIIFANIEAVGESNQDSEYDEIGQPTSDVIYDLTFEIPGKFESSKYNTDSYKYYDLLESTTDYCDASMITMPSLLYDDVYDYIDSLYYPDDAVVSDISTKSINGTKWYTISMKTDYDASYYYFTLYGDKYYKVNFNVYKDSGLCTNGHNRIIDSLDFE